MPGTSPARPTSRVDAVEALHIGRGVWRLKDPIRVAAVTFVLTTGLSTSLGYGKSLAPMVAGWAPPLLYGLIAAFLGLRLMGVKRR